jgi:glutaconate CoA-transferase, subunit A
MQPHPQWQEENMFQTKFVSLDDLVALVPDGCSLAIIKDDSSAPSEAARALVRREVRDLHLLTVPTGGYPSDLLIGAGCVASIETSGVSLGEFGPAPQFGKAVKSGSITLRDATCPAVYAALQAGEKGLPFIPIRGIMGSDLAVHREDWKVIDNPFAKDGETDPVLLLPAIRPDVALIHAEKADRFGNVWVGREKELATVAHAAHRTLVTTEEIVDEDLMAKPETAAGCLSAMYVEAIAVAERGAWPVGLGALYSRDEEHLQAYATAARDDETFKVYLQRYVTNVTDRVSA